jgi:hypothetical protein
LVLHLNGVFLKYHLSVVRSLEAMYLLSTKSSRQSCRGWKIKDSFLFEWPHIISISDHWSTLQCQSSLLMIFHCQMHVMTLKNLESKCLFSKSSPRGSCRGWKSKGPFLFECPLVISFYTTWSTWYKQPSFSMASLCPLPSCPC